MKIIIAIFIILLISINIQAQTVDSLIDEAVRNNSLLKSLKYKINSAEQKSETVGYLPPPSLGVEFSQIPIKEPDPIKNAMSQSLIFSQMIMLGGKLSAMTEAEKQNINIETENYNDALLKITAGVREQYYKIWMNEHHIELREELRDILKDIESSVESSYKTGKARYSDLLLIQTERVSNETEISNLENELKSEFYKMNYFLGRDLSDSSLIVGHNWEIDSISISLNDLENNLLEQNPSLNRMNSMIRMNELERTANKKDLFPDLMLQGMLMRMPRGMILTTKSDPAMFMGMGETEYMYSVMASVTLPFMPWSSGRINYRDEELSAGISSLTFEKENMQREMISTLRSLIKKLENKKSQVRLYDTQILPLYRKTLEAQLVEFSNNQISITPILDTYRMLLMKEEEQGEFIMEHQMIASEIYMMTGDKNSSNVRGEIK